MIAHYARVAITHAKIISTFADCDLTFKHIDGVRPPHLELSLDGRCVENRLLPDLDAKTVDDIIGKEIWIALLSEARETIGFRGWEYMRPYRKGDRVEDIEKLPPPKIGTTWELLARISQNMRNGGPGGHPPQ